MFKHHKETIDNLVAHLKNQEDEILALLVTGSIAHGFATEKSDVDVMFIVSNETYDRKKKEGHITYYNNELCNYEHGYVDGKFITMDFINQVAKMGSEPARFAFEGAKIIFSKVPDLEQLLHQIVDYPKEDLQTKYRKFYGQLEAWRWFYYEGEKHKNTYLLDYSISHLILFGGRLILAYNNTLFPFHKWFNRVLSEVPNKPEGLMEAIEGLMDKRDAESVEEFFSLIKDFHPWVEEGFSWSHQYVLDSELNWLSGYTPVGDL